MTSEIQLTEYEILGLSIFKSLSDNSIQSPSRFTELFFIEAADDPEVETPNAMLTDDKSLQCKAAKEVLSRLNSNGLISPIDDETSNPVYKLTHRGHAICSSIRCKKATLSNKLSKLFN